MIPYGTRVKYSPEWLDPISDSRKKARADARRGTVVTRRRSVMRSDCCECVLWDCLADAETIHRKFLAPVDPADIGLWKEATQ
jgi:hypothetical protein